MTWRSLHLEQSRWWLPVKREICDPLPTCWRRFLFLLKIQPSCNATGAQRFQIIGIVAQRRRLATQAPRPGAFQTMNCRRSSRQPFRCD